MRLPGIRAYLPNNTEERRMALIRCSSAEQEFACVIGGAILYTNADSIDRGKKYRPFI